LFELYDAAANVKNILLSRSIHRQKDLQHTKHVTAQWYRNGQPWAGQATGFDVPDVRLPSLGLG